MTDRIHKVATEVRTKVDRMQADGAMSLDAYHQQLRDIAAWVEENESVQLSGE